MKYYEYSICVLLLILIFCIFYLAFRLKKITKLQEEIIDSLFFYESAINELKSHVKNIDDDMYSISQKHGLRVSNNRF